MNLRGFRQRFSRWVIIFFFVETFLLMWNSFQDEGSRQTQFMTFELPPRRTRMKKRQSSWGEITLRLNLNWRGKGFGGYLEKFERNRFERTVEKLIVIFQIRAFWVLKIFILLYASMIFFPFNKKTRRQIP